MPEELLLPSTVAARLGVDRRTLLRWAQAELISSVTTAGGYRRYRLSDLEAFRADVTLADRDQMLSRSEIVARFDITDSAVRYLYRNDWLPWVMTPGGQRRFRLGDVQAALAARAARREALNRSYAGGGSGLPR